MKNRIKTLLALCAFSSSLVATSGQPAKWLVLKHYDGQHLAEVALHLRGIGTGTVPLGGRGELCDWGLMNVPAKKYSTVTIGNNTPFFAIYAKPEGGAQCKVTDESEHTDFR